MLTEFLAAEREATLPLTAKGLPTSAYRRPLGEVVSAGLERQACWTPLVTLEDEALAHNVALMADWTAARGLRIMPHGKTTMSPNLWQRQLEAGATGIALATLGQVRMARAAGLGSIMLANEAVDPAGLAWLSREHDAANFEFWCWADTIEVIEAMERELIKNPPVRKINVLVELGVDGKRTGARGTDAAVALARRIVNSEYLRLAGVAGYEGVIGGDREPGTLTQVRSFLTEQVNLHRAIASFYDEGPLIVTAGGSAYFDLVAEVYAQARSHEETMPVTTRTSWVIRSGAYLTHDEGHYRGLNPLDAEFQTGNAALRPALAGYSRVVSAPEPGLALCDAGKRDFPYDIDLPIVTGVADTLAGPFTDIDAEVTKLNDQHAFVRLAPGTSLRVGQVLRFGLSHPCTTFDKWAVLPVVDERGAVTDFVRTYF